MSSTKRGREDQRIDRLKAARTRAEEREGWAYANQLEVYQERDLLVGALARVYPSHVMRNSRNGKLVLCIHSPAGQLAWTLHTAADALMDAIQDLPETGNDWDRAKTSDRLQRLEQLARRASS